MSEGINDGFRADVPQGDGSGPPGKSVNYGEEVPKAIGLGHHCDVCMNMSEMTIRDMEFANFGDDVAMDL